MLTVLKIVVLNSQPIQ